MGVTGGIPFMKGTRALVVAGLFLLPVLMHLTILPTAVAKGLDWGHEKEITDPKDYYRMSTGAVIGYLDKGAVVTTHNGRMYVAWETSERKAGGSMIYIRSLKGETWRDMVAVGGVEDGIIDTEPAIASFNGDLYVAWQHAGGDDTEILCRALVAGDWQDCGEISGPDDYAIDETPALAVYDGVLWAAWVTHSVVTGKDSSGGDIAIRTYDGQGWSSKITILNPTPANGYDRMPELKAYREKLVAAWATRDPKISNGTDADIVFREYNGESWGPIREVTAPDGADADDVEPALEVYDEKLWFAWQSDGENVYETDIHVASWDGTKVYAEKDLNPPSDNAADEHPSIKAFGGRLYVSWNSNDPNYTNGADDDIAIAFLDSGKWSDPQEVTSADYETSEHASVAAQDRFPIMESFEGGLFVIWEQDDQRADMVDAGDLKYKRHPPFGSGPDYTLYAMILIIVVLVVAIAAQWYLKDRGRMTPRERRKRERNERESVRRIATSRAGQGSRSRRKGKGRRK